MWRAAVLVLLAACGDGLTLPDAAAHPPDSDIGLVRVQYLGGVPEGNVVMFQAADGSLVLATRTDAEGQANAYMRAGGTATIIGTNGNSHLMFTWTGVQPGDELVLDRRAFSEVPFTRAYQVTVPLAPDANAYRLLTSCGSFVFPPFDVVPEIVVDLRGCVERTDMLVLAGPNFSTRSYLHAADVSLSSIGINLAGEYRPLESSAVNVSGGPTDSAFGLATQFLIAQGRELYRSATGGIALSGGLGQLVHAMPLPPGSTLMTLVRFNPAPSAIGAHFATTWGPAKAATPVNVSATRVHDYTSRGVYEPNSQRVTWGEGTTGALADAVLVQVGWYRPGIGENFQWQVLARRGADPIVQLPQLPGRDFTPREGDTLVQPTTLVNIKIEGGYDRIRTSLLGRWTPGETWPADTASGSVVYEDLASPF